MARRKKATAADESPEETPVEAPVEPVELPKPARKSTVKLRLKQNDFIGGKFAKKGTTVEVSEDEGHKRMTTEDKWEYV